MNYYEFYDLPVQPSVDQALLKKRFYQKSKEYHPDFYTLADDSKQAEVLELSSLNNQAYKTLADDDQRLKYFLEYHEALADEGQNQVPQAFLMEIMDINENLMELQFDEDPDLRKQTSAMIDELEETLANQARPLLEVDYTEGDHADELNRLKEYYLKHRYLLRIREKL